MTHYLLYLPRAVGADPDNLRKVGLDSLLRGDDLGPKFADLTSSGPDDGPGQIATWQIDGGGEGVERNPVLDYIPDKQTWIPARPDKANDLPGGHFWLGVENASLPKPTDMQRRSMVGGFVTKLSDGNMWQLPNMLSLPCSYAWDDSGDRTNVPSNGWSDVYDRMAWAFDTMTGDAINTAIEQLKAERGEDFDAASVIPSKVDAATVKPASLDEMITYCVEMLCVNYRINLPVLMCLQVATNSVLFSDENLWNTMAQTCDLEKFRSIWSDLEKKRALLPAAVARDTSLVEALVSA